MKKNLLKKASVYFINFLVVLMIVVLPVATVQAASQIETPIETRSKQNSNLEIASCETDTFIDTSL